MNLTAPISPLQLADLFRDLWGQYDAAAVAQLAPLAHESCFAPKIYSAPDLGSQVFAADSYLNYGLQLVPGSIIYGFYLPADPSTFAPGVWNLQITDSSVEINGRPHTLWDEPVPSLFVSNYKPTYCSALAFPTAGRVGSFPSLLAHPYPVVGSGHFGVEIWETSGVEQRIQLCIGVLEPVA